MKFCSHDRYIRILEDVGADIIEVTGDHNNDYGTEPSRYTLDLYEKRGWKWYGGGRDLADAQRPAQVALGPTRLAFIGCNRVGPPEAWATQDQPGALPCKERSDFERVLEAVRQARAGNVLPIVTMQHFETYEYTPLPIQNVEFHELAAAGAVFVSGSQAHQPQGFGLPQGALIHYGVGNLLFDQMQSLGTRQQLVDLLTFYNNRLLSVELHTFMLEEFGRPRPMSHRERRELLSQLFAASTWW
jgi:poly-gamma-glutamate synthesis protein (capsule biosynthesis protein)